MYKLFSLKKYKLIIQNVELVKSNFEKLSLKELVKITDELRKKVDSVADELNTQYISHYDKVESDFNTMKNSTNEFQNSIL